MRIGRHLTVQEVYNQINHFHSTIEQTVEQTVQCMLNTDSVIGKIAALIGLNDTVVPVTALSRTSQTIPNNDFTPITWDTVLIDGLGAFDTDHPTYLSLPVDGIYHINFVVTWDDNAVGVRKSWLSGVIEPSGFMDKTVGSTDACMVTISGEFSVYHLNTIRPEVYQNTGDNLGVYKAEIFIVRRCLMPHIVEY